jgi:hypothetical protein
MADIVLAHGILGYGTLPLGESLYFNGIANLYRADGHRVLVPTVATLGNLDLRSAQLRNAITVGFPASPQLISHRCIGDRTRSSTPRPMARGPWGAIGWPSGQLGVQAIGALLQPPAGHLRRYKDLLATVLLPCNSSRDTR